MVWRSIISNQPLPDDRLLPESMGCAEDYDDDLLDEDTLF